MDSLFKTKTGKVILSVLWGLGIAALFYKVCENAGCFVINEKNTPDVEKNIYEFRTECFNGNGQPCAPVYTDDGAQPCQRGCEQPYFGHPALDFYEDRTAKNCGDPRYSKEPGCYKFHPMDSIFRAPSSQIYYPYH
jgi:hypothetical protein